MPSDVHTAGDGTRTTKKFMRHLILTRTQELVKCLRGALSSESHTTCSTGLNRVCCTKNFTSDDSAEQIRLMIDAVLRSFRKHFIRSCRGSFAEAFMDAGWFCHKSKDEARAAMIARNNDHVSQKPSAGEVMRFTYEARRRKDGPHLDAFLSANVRVRWVGEIDAGAMDKSNNRWPQLGGFLWWCLHPFFSAPIADKTHMKCKTQRITNENPMAQESRARALAHPSSRELA